MKQLLLRCFWWIHYITKFAYLLLAVTVVCVLLCVLVRRFSKKKMSSLYVVIFAAALIPAFIAGIRMGMNTFDILVFYHPVITVIAAFLLHVLLCGIRGAIWGIKLSERK